MFPNSTASQNTDKLDSVEIVLDKFFDKKELWGLGSINFPLLLLCPSEACKKEEDPKRKDGLAWNVDAATPGETKQLGNPGGAVHRLSKELVQLQNTVPPFWSW